MITQVRYDVAGGRFHGFYLAHLKGADILADECRAALDDGRIYPLKIRKRKNVLSRVILGGDAEVERGGVNFALVHSIDLFESGALTWHEGRARLDFTPFVWKEGLDLMKIEVVLPKRPQEGEISLDKPTCKDYEVNIQGNTIDITKFRPVPRYAMRVVLDVDAAAFPGLSPQDTLSGETKPALAAASTLPASASKGLFWHDTPLHVAGLPAFAALLGLVCLLLKAAFVRRVHRQAGLYAGFRILDATPISLRCLLSAGGLALGLYAQYAGSVTASVPPLAAIAALWISRPNGQVCAWRPGGSWREMSLQDLSRYQTLARHYRRSLRSVMDITSPVGCLSYTLVLAGLGCIAALTHKTWPHISWAAVINGLILMTPAWFANVRAELPFDSTLESFNTLRKWPRALCRLIGATKSEGAVSFWVREDAQGPIETRLRVNAPSKDINGIEVAVEFLRSASITRTRIAAVFRIAPGTDVARKLAHCPHAVAHHLTPDLAEEVVVLRNRRGRKLGLMPVRAALVMLRTAS